MRFHSFGFSSEILESLQQLGYETTTRAQQALIPSLTTGLGIAAQAGWEHGAGEAVLLSLLSRATPQPAIVTAPTLPELQQLHSWWHSLGAAINGIAEPEWLLPQDLPLEIPSSLPFFAAFNLDVLTAAQQGSLAQFLSNLPATAQWALLTQHTPIPSMTWLPSRFITSELGISGDDIASLPQMVWSVAESHKVELLIRLCQKEPASHKLVWVKTAAFAEQLARKLRVRQVAAASYYFGYSESQRNKIQEAFLQGQYRVLILSDGRAADIVPAPYSHIVFFDLPDDSARYMGLLESVNQKAGNPVIGWSLVGAADEESLINIELGVGHPLWRIAVPDSGEGTGKKQKGFEQGARREKVAPVTAPAPTRQSYGRSPQPPPRDEEPFVWDAETPRTWGDRHAMRQDPPKMALESWELPPPPDIWRDPPRIKVRPSKYPGILGKPAQTAQAILWGIPAPAAKNPPPPKNQPPSKPSGNPKNSPQRPPFKPSRQTVSLPNPRAGSVESNSKKNVTPSSSSSPVESPSVG